LVRRLGWYRKYRSSKGLTASDVTGRKGYEIEHISVGACALLILPTGAAVAGPCTPESNSLTKLMASRDAGAGPGAVSPQDVQSQTRGGPTAAEQAEGARRPASDQLASSQAALEEARRFDRAGQEAQCMDAIARAKQLAR
jgi:hypothetical protein